MAGLFKRLKDVVSAEAHDLIDSRESPEKIARQLVRETTDKVELAQKLTIDAVTSEKELAIQLEEKVQLLKKFEAAAEAAVLNDNTDAARRAIESKLNNQKLIDTLSPQLERARSNSATLKNQLATLQQRLNTLKAEKLVIDARVNGAVATGKIDSINTAVTLSDNTSSRLERANSMVSAMEARNEAVSEVNSVINPDTCSDVDVEVEREIQQLREKMGQ